MRHVGGQATGNGACEKSVHNGQRTAMGAMELTRYLSSGIGSFSVRGSG